MWFGQSGKALDFKIMPETESLKKYYRVDKKKIGYIKFIIEAYDGIAVLTTVDSGKGIISLSIPPGCETDIKDLMENLSKRIMIKKYEEKISIY